MLSAICFNLDQSKILSYGNELNMQNSQQHISIALRLGGLTLYYTIPTFNDPEKERPFENIVGKGENAGNQHFPLFPKYFLPIPKRISVLSYIYCVACKWFQFGPV